MNRVQVGDRVVRDCTAISGVDPRQTIRLRGTVVWIHPKGRFHLVRFLTPGGPLLECFQGVRRRLRRGD